MVPEHSLLQVAPGGLLVVDKDDNHADDCLWSWLILVHAEGLGGSSWHQDVEDAEEDGEACEVLEVLGHLVVVVGEHQLEPVQRATVVEMVLMLRQMMTRALVLTLGLLPTQSLDLDLEDDQSEDSIRTIDKSEVSIRTIDQSEDSIRTIGQ